MTGPRPPMSHRDTAPTREAALPRITKDCFGTVIASLKKMKECVRCEVLAECRAINWQGGEVEAASQVVRRPLNEPTGGAPTGEAASGECG